MDRFIGKKWRTVIAMALLTPLWLIAAGEAQLQAVRAATSPVIDGSLNDAAWERAAWSQNFSAHNEFRPAGTNNEVALLYDDEAFYLGFRAFDNRLDESDHGNLNRDEMFFSEDGVDFYLKAVDAPVFYHFAVNTMGTQFDSRGDEIGWNGQWSAACQKKGGNRREYEIRIPFKLIGIQPQDGKSLRMMVARFSRVYDELAVCTPWFGGFAEHPDGWPLVKLCRDFGGSFAVDQKLLTSANPRFSTKLEQVAEPKQLSCRVEIFPKGGSLPIVSTRIRDFSNPVLLIGKPLVGGKYRAEITWYDQNEILSRNAIVWTVVAPKKPTAMLSFSAELIQPWFENEKALRIAYSNRGGAAEMSWKLFDRENGKELASGNAPLAASGIVELAMPEAVGKYSLEVAASGLSQKLEFEKAAPIGTSRQWFTIDKEGFWVVDGKRRFPIVMYGSGYDELLAYRKMGVDLAIGGADWWHSVEGASPDIVTRNLQQLDAAATAGVPVAMSVCNMFRSKTDYASLRYAVARMKNHPALAAWYIADEPALQKISPEVIHNAAKIVHEIDPLHPVIGCEVKEAKFGSYLPSFDLAGIDPYPDPDGDLSQVERFIATAQRQVSPHQMLFVILRGFGKPFTSKHPSTLENWNMTLQGLATGVNGISWWCWKYMKEEPGKYLDTIKLVNTLNPWLVQGMPKTVVRNGILFGRFPGLLIAVNLTREPAEARLPGELPGKLFRAEPSVSLKNGVVKLPARGGAIWKSDEVPHP